MTAAKVVQDQLCKNAYALPLALKCFCCAIYKMTAWCPHSFGLTLGGNLVATEILFESEDKYSMSRRVEQGCSTALVAVVVIVRATLEAHERLIVQSPGPLP